MSRAAVVDFLESIRRDAALRGRLEARPTLEAYLAEGARAGFEFSLEEARGVTQADRFYEQALSDAALSRRIGEVTDPAALVALARTAGCDCTAADLEAVVVGSASGAELSESQLDAVAGGGKGFPSVCKVPTPFGTIPVPYPEW
jgi:predicted ribosomally synthesized peptide with nif11-like leader